MSAELSLVESPRASYLEELIACLRRAERFWMVTAFASASGIDLIAPALQELLKQPHAQGQLYVAVDRRGFNAAKIFESLLALKRDVGPRLELGLVPERTGLLHAKALLGVGPTGADLLVGSANLTRSAFIENHELGILARGVDIEIQSAFKRFLRNLAPVPLDEASAAPFLTARGLMTAGGEAAPRRSAAGQGDAWAAVLRALPPAALRDPEGEEPEEGVARWIGQGYIVGRGRRALEALVIRMPLEALEQRDRSTTAGCGVSGFMPGARKRAAQPSVFLNAAGVIASSSSPKASRWVPSLSNAQAR